MSRYVKPISIVVPALVLMLSCSGGNKEVAVTGISVTPSSVALHPGDTSTVSAVVSPNNATDPSFTWSSNNPSVATCSNGTITAHTVGSATITATTNQGNFKSSCNVTVNTVNIAVTGVQVTPSSVTLHPGETSTVSAVVSPNNATDPSFTWSSNNPSVATCSNGTITAHTVGSATITATTNEGSFKSDCNVSVTPRLADLGWTTSTWSGMSTFTFDRNIFTINSNNRDDDAHFSRVFQVKPNTQYVFSADVTSTAGRSSETPNSTGANIGVPSGSATRYDHDQGGWQTLECLIDSKNNTELTLVLRQGYYGSTVNGITQFKNIKLQERQIAYRDSNWNFLCLVLRNVDANITADGRSRNVKRSMDDAMVDAAVLQLNRFKTAIETMSNRQMTANLDIHIVDTPVTSLSYHSPTFGFWLGPQDTKHILKPYLESKNYDQVVAMVQFNQDDGALAPPVGRAHFNGYPLSAYLGKNYNLNSEPGYSQILMDPSGVARYYDPNVPNQYYVTANVHEFIHTLGAISVIKGIIEKDINDIAGEYGYGMWDGGLGEWQKFQLDYLNCNINSIDPPPRKIGCTQETYMLDRYGPNITIYELLQ